MSESDRQQRMYDFIVAYKAAHDGRSPTIREIGDACDISSTSVVNYNLAGLARAGFIARPAGESRAITVRGGAWRYGGPDPWGRPIPGGEPAT